MAYALSPFQNQCFKELAPAYIDTMPFKFHHISSFKQIFIDVNITGVKREFIVLQLFAVYFTFAHKNMKSQCRNPYSLVLTSLSREQPIDLLSVNLFVKS